MYVPDVLDCDMIMNFLRLLYICSSNSLALVFVFKWPFHLYFIHKSDKKLQELDYFTCVNSVC